MQRWPVRPLLTSVWVVSFSVAILTAAPAATAQQPVGWAGERRFTTFSIAAIDPETGEAGVAVTSRVPCVGNVVPHVRAGVGAVATQAATRIEYGKELLDLLAEGVDPKQAIDQTLTSDPRRGARQIGVIAVNGRSAQYTGPETVKWAGHRAGRNYVTQGNLLVDASVLDAVARKFESTAASGRPLADRLIDALAAGEAAGGDSRKGLHQSAAVLVAHSRPGMSHRPDEVTTDINICEHEDPVRELRRSYNAVTERLGYRRLQQFHGHDVFQLRLILHALGYYRKGEPEPRPDVTSHFYTSDLVAAVNAFREAEGLSGPDTGTPPGLVDLETVDRLWAALERKGLADDLHRKIRDLSR